MTSNERSGPRWTSAVAGAIPALAGPVLIAGSVLVVLRDFAFRGMLSAQHPDLIQAWLPFHCFLGRSLASGHIPAWNPYGGAGMPFAADPQSGWMNLPAMAMYSTLPCNRALGLYLVLQPILGGLGLYWFLRAERISRPAAVSGGLVLALMVSGSTVGLELPFSAAVAWSAVLLAAAARYVRASTWPKRVAWAAACAVSWGQIAAAHLSHGLLIGTGALVAYLAARVIGELRGRTSGGRRAFVLLALLLAVLPLVNLAALLPRLGYLPRTSLALGYDGLAVRAAQLAGSDIRPLASAGNPDAGWPLTLMTSAGPYLGVVASVLSLGALWDRGLRRLAVAFTVYAAVAYALSLEIVAERLASAFASIPLFDFYLHAPIRLAHGTRLAVAVLVGLGVEAWCRAPGPARRALMVASGLVVWWLLAGLIGDLAPGARLLGVGIAGGVLAIVGSAWRPRLAMLLPATVALELGLNALWGQTVAVAPLRRSDHVPLRRPTVDGAAYVQPQAIERHLLENPGGRYATFARGGLEVHVRGLLARSPPGWNAAANQRSMLFGLEDVDVYNPAQPLRSWSFVRAFAARQPKYNAGYFTRPSAVAFDLLDVGWVVAPTGRPPAPAATRALTASGWTLFRLASVRTRASVHTSWTEAATADQALATIRAGGFDPRRQLVLEGWEARPAGGLGGTASYQATGPQSARIVVNTDTPAVVVVRNPYDPNWRATVDGRSAPVLPADYVVQGIPVPAGAHVVELRYDDPTLGLGLLFSALALGLMLGGALLGELRSRRVARR